MTHIAHVIAAAQFAPVGVAGAADSCTGLLCRRSQPAAACACTAINLTVGATVTV